jgi:predicted DNA-binding protein|tara:strand:+ start:8107 stop:8262 length:156 start_codon:yes stop_codon:yes gene_type:complete
MTEPSKTWNIVFPFRLINRIRDIASKQNVTAASVVREAAERYVEEEESEKK